MECYIVAYSFKTFSAPDTRPLLFMAEISLLLAVCGLGRSDPMGLDRLKSLMEREEEENGLAKWQEDSAEARKQVLVLKEHELVHLGKCRTGQDVHTG